LFGGLQKFWKAKSYKSLLDQENQKQVSSYIDIIQQKNKKKTQTNKQNIT
jgi:hypothetical protein